MQKQDQKKQGLFVVIAAIAVQLTVGIAYVWSVFQNGVARSIFPTGKILLDDIGEPVRNSLDEIVYQGDNAAASLTFSVLLLAMTLASVLGGKLAARYSTKLVVFIGGIMIAAGFFLASFVTKDIPWMLWLTYGVLGGAGMGFTYTPAIACAQKWYPHKKGMITGVIVAALGFGTVIFAPVAEELVKMFGGIGVGEPRTFMVLSAVFLVVCSAGSLLMKNPPEGYTTGGASGGKAAAALKPVKDVSTSQMLKTPQFYLTFFTMLLACMGGQMIIGFARPIAEAKGLSEIAGLSVMVVALANATGRLVWGMVSDKLGRINMIILLLAGTAGISLLVNAATGYMVFGLIAFFGLVYGGFLSNFPSLTADLFGAKSQGSNYGCVLVSFGIGAIISSQIAGHFKNLADEAGDINLMFPAFIIASCCAAAGIVMMLILKAMNKKPANRAGASAPQES